MGILKANNAGLVTTTAVAIGDLCHTLPVAAQARTAIIRKIMWYNNTGAAATLIFGTRDNVGVGAWVPLFPTINCVNGMDGELMEDELPEIEIVRDTSAGAAGTNGNIYVVSSVALILVRLTVEETTGQRRR